MRSCLEDIIYCKDRERIDRFFNTAARFGYTERTITLSGLISQHDNNKEARMKP